MNQQNRWANEIEDQTLAEAIGNFKSSVDAWSEAASQQPRRAVLTVRHSWRRAAAWAFSCILVAASLTGGGMEIHHRQQAAKLAAQMAEQRALQQKEEASKQAAVAAATDDQDLLAAVDSDVSQQTPAAMEPLAQLMNSSGTK
jgi:hypothetical protein